MMKSTNIDKTISAFFINNDNWQEQINILKYRFPKQIHPALKRKENKTIPSLNTKYIVWNDKNHFNNIDE